MRRVVSMFHAIQKRLGPNANFGQVLEELLKRKYFQKMIANRMADEKFAKTIVALTNEMLDDIRSGNANVDKLMRYSQAQDTLKKLGIVSKVTEFGEVIPELALRAHKPMEKHYQELLWKYLQSLDANDSLLTTYLKNPQDKAKVLEILKKWKESPYIFMHHLEHCGAEYNASKQLVLHRCLEDVIPNKTETLDKLFSRLPVDQQQGKDALMYFLEQYVQGHLNARRPEIGYAGLKYLESIGFKIPNGILDRLRLPQVP